MYSYIYNSTVAFYSKQKIDTVYIEKYAVVTLSLLAFFNLMTVLLVCLHLKYTWAQAAFVHMRSRPAALLTAALCFAGVQGYSMLHRKTLKERSRREGQSWIGGTYIIVSVVLFLFTAKWAPHADQPVPYFYLEDGHLKESSAP
jgi:hypothetical protein